MRDDSLMSRFDQRGLRRFGALQTIVSILIALLVLAILSGDSVRREARKMRPGPGRNVVRAVGHPAGWVADHLPLARAVDRITDNSPKVGSEGFRGGAASMDWSPVPPVTPEAFDAEAIGAKRSQPQRLRTLLVTGDSMSMPLDLVLARRLASKHVRVIRDPHPGTGISNTQVADWGELSAQQTSDDHADAVIVFIGANEGYPFPDGDGGQVECCEATWAAIFATRARDMIAAYRRDGRAHVYWLTLPVPRDPERHRIARVVDAAVEVAAQPWRSDVRIVDVANAVTPHDRYRASMRVDGDRTIIRASDGIHLNEAGAEVAADMVMDALRADLRYD